MHSTQRNISTPSNESIQYGTPTQREITKKRRVQKKRVALIQRLVFFAVISICSIGFLTVQLINQELAISKKVDQKEQLEQQKQQLEDAIFMEKMSDFMDWENYYNLKNELQKVNAQLEALN